MGESTKACGPVASLFFLALALLAPARADTMPGGPPVDLPKYLGLWYEIARTPNFFEDNTPKKNGTRYSACFNATADYALRAPGQIDIVNTCTREAEDGAQIRDAATGIGLIEDGSGGRKLRIAFGPGIARFFQRVILWGGARYWIYCLGPENADGLYDWAVVSGKSKEFVFVLTRERAVADPKRQEILACAADRGLSVEALIYQQR